MSTILRWRPFLRWWGLWLVVTVLGSVGSGTLGGAMGPGGSDVLAPLLVVDCWVGSVLVGLGQALVLGQRISGAAWWVPATFAGRFLGWPLSAALMLPLAYLPIGEDPLPTVVAVAVASALLGSVQWLVLRIQIKNAYWWIPASVFGWCLRHFAEKWVLDAFDVLGDHSGATSVWLWSLIFGIAGGLVVGTVTGCAVALLLSQQTLSDQWSQHVMITTLTPDP